MERLCIQLLESELKAEPKNPMLLTAVGDLYEELDDYRKGADYFLEAVKTQPNCLMAWESLNAYQDQMNLPLPIQQEAALNLLRLDPFELENRTIYVKDYRALWAASTKIGDAIQVTEPVFPLPKSAEHMDGNDWENYENGSEYLDRLMPGAILADDHTISDFCKLFGAL